jgi:hypothetical protein
VNVDEFEVGVLGGTLPPQRVECFEERGAK